MTARPQREHKSARLAALLALDDLGLLDGVSDIRLAEVMGLDRSNAWRYRKLLPMVRELRSEYMRRLLKPQAPE